MPCLAALLALISPRLALAVLFLFSNMLDRAFLVILAFLADLGSYAGGRSYSSSRA